MTQIDGRYDVVIVGGGAAGLSAALVLGRARRKVLVIDAGAPRNAPAAHMHGFLSRDGLPPAELLALGRAEVQHYGVEVVSGEVVMSRPGEDGRVELGTREGRQVTARRVLVATGLRDELPDVPGLRERWGRDVLHCPYCHGWEVRDQRLAVIVQGTDDGVRYTQMIREWTHDLLLIVPGGGLSDFHREALAARHITVVETEPSHVLVSNDRVAGIALANGRQIERDAIFVPPRLVPNSALLSAVGCRTDDEGWPVTTGPGATSVPGIWVAGNVTNPKAQVITAAGEGSAAAIALNADLVEEDVRLAVRGT